MAPVIGSAFLRHNEPVAKRKRDGRQFTDGRPTLFPGGRRRTINLTEDAMEKAREDAAAIAERAEYSVSMSQAVEAAIRTFDPRKFKP